MRYRNSGIIKGLSIFTLFMVLLQCFPTATLAFELKSLKDSVRAFVEKRDNSVDAIKNKVNNYFDLTNTITTKFVKGGFSTLESQTGVNSENKLYNAVKKRSLEHIGFKLGGGKALKDTGLFATDLGAKLVTLPIGIVNLGYKVKDNPKKYQESLSNGAKTFAGVILNPLPVAKNLYQNFVTVQNKAKQDPLEWGKFQGEFVTYGAMSVLPTGNVKVPSTLKNVLSTVKTSAFTKTSNLVNKIDLGVLIPDINLGYAPTPVLGGAVRGAGEKTAVKWVPSIKTESTIAQISQKAENGLFNFNVGDLFNGVKIADKKGRNQLILANKEKLYANIVKYPNEVYSDSKLVTLIKKNGLLYTDTGKLAHGVYPFVIDHRSKFLTGVATPKVYHGEIAKGLPVKWAGMVRISKGKIYGISNESGHYLPKAEDFLNMLPILKEHLPNLTEKMFQAIKL